MAEEGRFNAINHEISSLKLDESLSACETGADVLKVYLKLERPDKIWLTQDQEKVAFRLAELGENDIAVAFIQMAERRRSNNSAIEALGEKFRDLGMTDLNEQLVGIVGALTSGR